MPGQRPLNTVRREIALPIAQVPPLAYSVSRLADALGLGRTTIYRLVQAKELHPIKVCGRTLFVASEVTEWLDRKLAEAKGEGGEE